MKVIKRVAGLPRDTLAMRAGILYRNGQQIQESYVVHREPTRSEDTTQRAKMRNWQIAHLWAADTDSYTPDLQDWGDAPSSFSSRGAVQPWRGQGRRGI